VNGTDASGGGAGGGVPVPPAPGRRASEKERVCRPRNNVATIGGEIVLIARRADPQRVFEGVEVGLEAFVVPYALLLRPPISICSRKASSASTPRYA
jgi:hypothetical protein